MSVGGDSPKRMVFVSLEPWDEVWRRNQFVCRELNTRGWEILFVEPAADWSAGFRRRDWSQFERRPVWSPEGLDHIKVLRPLKLLPKSIAATQAVNVRLLRKAIASFCAAHDWREPVLWINDQQAWPLAQSGVWDRVIYDVTDDWSTGFTDPALRRRIENDDRALCALADQVIVCSQRLVELKRGLSKHVTLVPNGVDIEAYRAIDDAMIPDAASIWTHPVLGYTGTLHPERMDMDLLVGLARNWKGTIALIGPDQLGSAGAALSRLPNVIRTGAVPHASLPGWMRAMDVLIVPHRVTAFTESLNPLKLWEYLATGRPIVSTSVAGFRDYAQHVRIADDMPSFIKECITAVSNPECRHTAWDDPSGEHSWSARVNQIEQLLLQEQNVLTCQV